MSRKPRASGGKQTRSERPSAQADSESADSELRGTATTPERAGKWSALAFWRWRPELAAVWVPAFLTVVIAIFGATITMITANSASNLARANLDKQIQADVQNTRDARTRESQVQAYSEFMDAFIEHQEQVQRYIPMLLGDWMSLSEDVRSRTEGAFDKSTAPVNRAALRLYIMGSPEMVGWVSHFTQVQYARNRLIAAAKARLGGLNVPSAKIVELLESANSASDAAHPAEFLRIAREDLDLPDYGGELPIFSPLESVVKVPG